MVMIMVFNIRKYDVLLNIQNLGIYHLHCILLIENGNLNNIQACKIVNKTSIAMIIKHLSIKL